MGLAEGNLDVTLPRHLGAIGDAGADVGLLDPGINIQKLFDFRACGEGIEDQGHPETVSFDAGLAKTNRGINGNPREQFFPGHGRFTARDSTLEGTPSVSGRWGGRVGPNPGGAESESE